MDSKALYNLSYGVFMLSTCVEGKAYGCITNTCMQVASNPTRVAISVINTNKTCEMLKQSGTFALSLLDETCSFDTIKYFGMQSGHKVDKFDKLDLPKTENGSPYLTWHTCAVLSCRVVDKIDLGSHSLFVAELVDAFITSENKPLTYSDYQNKLKPKTKAEPASKKIIGWRCKICNYYYEGSQLPEDYLCPTCGHDASDFEPVYES